MHVEVPDSTLKSFKDFLKHYLMIVLSILTALALEAWIERVHHQHAAEQASQQIDAEIRANLDEVHESLAKDVEQKQMLDKLRSALEQDLSAHAVDADVQRLVLSQFGGFGFNLNLRWPTLRQEAWDVAVANQSASWMNSQRLYHYSAVYASQREAAASLVSNLNLVIDGPRMIDTMTDIRSGHVDPHELLHVIVQMQTIQDQAKNELKRLEQQMQSALDSSRSSAP